MNILKEELKSNDKDIELKIFLNLIFPKICNILENCKEIKTIKEREIFEKNIELLLEDSYNEYNEYKKKYLNINKNSLMLDKDCMNSLML
jgi:hypothetical protein